ncbi:DUF4123 domain-containing protein [Xanthomonas fragariae]|uniref:Uncharacterized protein n=1 Tax=Xanthomonas fragariae TaxID=48664 RepID=A0A1Y6HSI1_9XANT|nr:DUF4123 domain-containing protein [Xanthomonas fragariae]AOD15805.1 hypothetical protein BER92_15210 [Xanthomonas fragariae]AOD19221.1 hypothetical protein BER93_15245 [Xanthomonas fragariae]ENZ95651.1 hypothetical protein O1K_08672 [Xanthomonas fragariae LMG 25863]MDM7573872.1 DUF4123 domain-containing protein [Xanthomonas fragariae]MDM7583145.1 DUF4123 domain-containing protein [Xanthomonas fragariae]
MSSTHPSEPSNAAKEIAESLAEEIQGLLKGVPDAQCHLLLQPPQQSDSSWSTLQQIIKNEGLSVTPIRIEKIPGNLWPCLLTLNLDRGMHAYISALAAEMACENAQLGQLRRGRTQSVAAWIFSKKAAPEVACNISRLALTRFTGETSRRWIRYYDPLITDLVWEICSEEQRASWLRQIDTWAYRDRRGNLTVLRSQDFSHESQEAASRPPCFQFGPDVLPKLQTIGSLNQAWIRASRSGREPSRQQLSAASRAMTVAWSAGLRSTADLDLFAWHAISLGGEFHMHPTVQEILARVHAGTETYCGLAQHCDIGQWQGSAERLSSEASCG